MSVSDVIIPCTLFLAGLTLILRETTCRDHVELIRKKAAYISDRHREWTRILSTNPLMRLQGAGLVNPGKSWVAAELFAFSFFAIYVNINRSLVGLLSGLLLALLSGGLVLAHSLRSEINRNIVSLRKDLPLAAFLMSLFLESGLGPSSAMRETVGGLPEGPCRCELGDIERSRSLGSSRKDSFAKARERIPLEEYRSFLNLVEQGEKLGVGLSEGLRELSNRLQESEMHRAETAAQKAAVKMLLPLALFIFPAVFLIVLSPVILGLLAMGGK